MIFFKSRYIFDITLLFFLGFIIGCADPLPIKNLSKAKSEISRAKHLGADKQAKPEYEEAQKYLLKTHELAMAEEPELDAIKNSADYAYDKAADAIEKTLPVLVSKAKEKAKKEIQLAEQSNAENFAPQEFNAARELMEEGDSASGQAEAQLSSYPNLEDTDSKNKARSEAFDTYEMAHKKYEKSEEHAKKAKEESLSKTQVLLDSATKIEERLDVIDKYSNENQKEQAIAIRKELNEGIANVQEGKVKDGQAKIDNAKSNTDQLYGTTVINYAQGKIDTAKARIQDAGTSINSIDRADLAQDAELSNSLANAEDNLKSANESVNSATDLYDKEKYEDSIDYSNEAIELANKSIIISKNVSESLEDKPTIAKRTNDKTEISDEGYSEEVVYIKPKKKAETTEKRYRKYRVKSKYPSDSLYRISRKFYGTHKYWKKIYRANKSKIKNPNKIYPNQVLIIPPKR